MRGEGGGSKGRGISYIEEAPLVLSLVLNRERNFQVKNVSSYLHL